MTTSSDYFLYRGAKTSQISFPLGGIGAGCIGLAGNGRLIDWEIFNRPNKGSVNGFSHFSIRAEEDSKVISARILHGDLPAPYQGDMHASHFQSFGWGPRRENLTGLLHFSDVAFRGEYPLAELTFTDNPTRKDGVFPGTVKLTAFNPLIPLNDKDSSIPAAFFEFSISNPTAKTLNYTLAGVLTNPLPANNLNSLKKTSWGNLLHLRSDGVAQDSPKFGDLTLATDAKETSGQQYWFRGAWFDSLEVYWHDLNTAGAFKNRVYPSDQAKDRNEGMLGAHVTVKAGETAKVRFVITWNFPICHNYWKSTANMGVVPLAGGPALDSTWKNYYASQWEDSQASAQYCLQNWDRLFAETKRFKDALFASTLPAAAIDAISGNISLLKSPTCLRLEDGTFYGWEGLHTDAGCCEGSCTHVWNYAQALPFLFPKLERSMRDADYKYNLRADGGMPFRIQLPIGSAQWAFRACCDGQFGGVLKTYRDWKICGDSEWLRSNWPAVKKSIEFAWSPENEDRWDPDKSGVLTGRQHHTLDMELFGPNSWLTGMYLGALKAGAEMATAMGEADTAAEYQSLFAKGREWADANLFNGEFYIQKIDLKDKTIVEAYAKEETLIQGGNTLQAYWNDEHKEIKYQIGAGSSIDQVLGQWHASLYGLGDLFDPEQVKKASAAIYKYNYIPVMGEVYNPCRIYCLNDEGGLVICAWPAGTEKPLIPAPYSQETMNGFEYSAAIHMIMNGLVAEGMTCIEAIRQRYDGERRNPWNEFECGSNYARSMAAYALLNAFSGFEFDMTKGLIGFSPLATAFEGRGAGGEGFRCFWSLDSGWGEFVQSGTSAEIRVLGGNLALNTVSLPGLNGKKVDSVQLGNQAINFASDGSRLNLGQSVNVGTNQALQIQW